MRFVGDVLNGVTEIQWYAIIGTFVFVAMFLMIVVKTYRMKKEEVNDYKNSIFTEEELSGN